MTTLSPSQVGGGGLSSPTQLQADVASPGMTTLSPSQVGGGGLSSPTQLQADVASPRMTTPSPSQVGGGVEQADLTSPGMTTPSPSTAGEAAISAVPVKRGSGRPPGSKTKKISVGSGTVPDHLSVCFFIVLESGVLLDGYVRGGNVAGLLTAATDVQVIVGSFNTQKSPLMSTLKSAMSVGQLTRRERMLLLL
ncbi:uncharacterized protein LOC114076111 [Solanum pennellii]|uniref:AT-hook motif nuclear-localized protein n=1 Tax=Solanum pennellii TaxID=28526 RepID=A0ABM1V3W9_SOLPN|nr:uncharacterized protein LOC114076111 [Solanum pennellii]